MSNVNFLTQLGMSKVLSIRRIQQEYPNLPESEIRGGLIRLIQIGVADGVIGADDMGTAARQQFAAMASHPGDFRLDSPRRREALESVSHALTMKWLTGRSSTITLPAAAGTEAIVNSDEEGAPITEDTEKDLEAATYAGRVAWIMREAEQSGVDLNRMSTALDRLWENKDVLFSGVQDLYLNGNLEVDDAAAPNQSAEAGTPDDNVLKDNYTASDSTVQFADDDETPGPISTTVASEAMQIVEDN